MNKLLVTLGLTLCALFPCACLSAEPGSAESMDAGHSSLHLAIYDYANRAAEPDAAPRAPRLIVHGDKPLDVQSAPVMLLRGALDRGLEADLARPPLLITHVSRLVPARVTYTTGEVTVVPKRPLDAGALYTLALFGSARFSDGSKVSNDDVPFTFELSTSSAETAGARVIASWPAAGAAGVASNLSFAAVVLDGEARGIEHGVWLEDPGGLAVPVTLGTFPCEELDARGHTCVKLVPVRPLQPLTRYTLRTGAGLTDAHDAPVEPFSAAFTTSATQDHRRPAWLAPACTIDELSLPIGCALIDDDHVELRVATDEPTRLLLESDHGRVVALAPRGDAVLEAHELSSGERMSITLTAFDAAGNVSRSSLSLTTETDLPRLSITEVRADPRGPEPDQEFVELQNYGDVPIALEGFALSDSVDEPGSVIIGDALAYPGARVLLVASTFDADSTIDAPVPAGAVLVRLADGLGKGGLSNSGEALFLRDPRGRRVSAAPSTPKPRSSVCIVRSSDQMRSGSASSFGYDAGGTCTPGE